MDMSLNKLPELVMLSNHLIFCHSFLLLPSIFPNIRVFFNDLTLYIWRSEVKWSHSVMSDSLRPHGLYSPGILQARILESVAVPFSRGSSQHRDQTRVSRIGGRCFTHWATREGHGGQDIGTLATDLAMKNQGWLLGLAGLITLQSSPVPQFKSIYSVFSIFYGSTPISIVVYWKNHRFDYMDLCQQSDFSAY